MTYDFFADEADKIDLLTIIFKETDLQIFDLSSAYGEKIKEYKSVDEIASSFDLKNEQSIHFQLWSPRFKVNPLFQRIELNPKYCNGHTFRYSTVGWGLIQLYFGGIKGVYLSHSHIGHFNLKGALGWEGINSFNGKVDSWDWNEIKKTSGKLKYFIDKKLAVKKQRSYGVLRGAEQLENQGITLIH